VLPEGRPAIDERAFSKAHATPSIRKFARELGADLGKIKGTGVKGRITQDDVKGHVKALLLGSPPRRRAPFRPLPRVPVVDFAPLWWLSRSNRSHVSRRFPERACRQAG